MNNPDKDWIFFLAWAFYFLNIAEITVDMVLYFRNVKLDAVAAGRYQEKHDARREALRAESVDELLKDGGKDPRTAKYGASMEGVEAEEAKKFQK